METIAGEKVKVLMDGKPMDGIIIKQTKTGWYEVAVKSFMKNVPQLLYFPKERIQMFDGSKPCMHDRCLVHTCNGDCLRD